MNNPRYRYQLSERRNFPGMHTWGVPLGVPEGAHGGFLTHGQGYSSADCVVVAVWLADREAGYPFGPASPACMWCEGALGCPV